MRIKKLDGVSRYGREDRAAPAVKAHICFLRHGVAQHRRVLRHNTHHAACRTQRAAVALVA